MNHKWQGIGLAAILSVAIGWWGLWYPELAKAAGAYAIVQEDGTILLASEVVECELDEEAFAKLLEAEDDQVRFRSRFLQWLEEYFEKDRSEE